MSALFPTSPRGQACAGLTILLLLAAAGGGAYVWLRAPDVPDVPLEGQETEVADKVNDARAALVKAPRSAANWGHLGQVLLANEISADVAAICFLQAERLEPDNPRWPYFAGALLQHDLNRPEEALPKLERAAELADAAAEPNFAPRLFLAETLIAEGKIDAAQAHFKKVLAADRHNPRAHFGLGLLAYARGDWQRCRAHLEACLGSPEARKRASVNLALVCERLDDREAADKYARLAAAAPKDFDWSDPYVVEYLHLAVRSRDRYKAVETLEAQGQFARATNILHILLADHPEDYRPHLMMGRIQGQMGQYASAERHLIKARQLAPDKIQVHYLLSLTYYQQGEALREKEGITPRVKALYEGSAQSARAALAIRSDYGYAHMSLGVALARLGDRAGGLAELRQAVHCNPEFADNHLFLGEALAEAGDDAGARGQFEQARLLANPNDPRPKAALDKLVRSKPKGD